MDINKYKLLIRNLRKGVPVELKVQKPEDIKRPRKKSGTVRVWRKIQRHSWEDE